MARPGADSTPFVYSGTLVPAPNDWDVGWPHVFTSSFPSGHATVSGVVFLTIAAVLTAATRSKQLKIFYLGVGLFLTLIVGISRIYEGVHYPTDVLAGWMIGSAWAILCWIGAQLLMRPPAPASNDRPV